MSKQISEEIIDALRHRADVIEIIGEHVALRKKGQNYSGLCPFHQEKTPSFVVSPVKQIYHCFGCGKGGNIFSFLMEKEGLAFNEVIEKLANRYGILLPDRELTPTQQKQVTQNKRFQQINEWAMLFFQESLAGQEGSIGRQYFFSRGLDDEIILRFKTGYSPDQWDSLYDHLKAKGVADEEMLLLGLVQKSQKGNLIDKFRNRVMFPILNDRGFAVGFGGRSMGDSQPKYLNTQDTPVFQKGRQLYGMNLAKSSIRQLDQVILMEGYMDVIAAHQNGILHAVASLGTALTQDQVKIITRYTYQTVISYDADSAGEMATMRGLEILGQQGCHVRVIRMPVGKDPDDFVRFYGREAYLQLVNKAFSFYEYKFTKNMEIFDKETMGGKVAIIQAMLPDLAKVKSPIERQGYITLMAETLSFPEAAIKEELRRHQKGIPAGPIGLPRPKLKEQGLEKALNTVFRILFQESARLDDFEAAGGINLFDNELAQASYLTMQALHKAGHKNLTAEDLVALTEDPRQRQWLTGVLLEDEMPGEENKVFQDSIIALKRHYMNQEIKELMDQLAQLERSGDASGAREIMHKISGLNKIKQTLIP